MDKDIRALRYTGGTRSPARRGMLALKSFVLLLFAVLAPLHLSPVWAGPIFMNQEQWERPPDPEPVEVRPIPVTIKNKAKNMREAFTLDLKDGLNVREAALLAVITHPYLVSVRNNKGLKIPQLINSGLLPPPPYSGL